MPWIKILKLEEMKLASKLKAWFVFFFVECQAVKQSQTQWRVSKLTNYHHEKNFSWIYGPSV